jgi:hypothetical protein
MQAVIGGYQSSQDAERAVRRLELEQFSIQDVIVADQRRRVWRKLSRWYDRRKSESVAAMPVLVVMSGRAEDVERAGHFLSRGAA